MAKRVFITGAAGFIGCHVALELSAAGIAVLGLDNFNDYYDVFLKESRAALLRKHGVQVLRADINDYSFLKEKIQEHQTTHVVHLAAQAGVRYSLENPHAYLKSNVDGFLNVLEACRESPGLKLVYASSSSVYGLNTKTPFCVDDRTDAQASLYGVTKKANELMAQTYHHLFGINSVGLRFFTVYGPWGRPDMAYYSFTRDILSGKAIKIFNNGRMKRDFTYIDDIVAGTIAALDHRAGAALFNLGNNQPTELGKMIELLEKLLGKEAEKDFLPMQAGDVVETYAMIDQSYQALGFVPKTSLEEGLERFVDWYRSFHHD